MTYLQAAVLGLIQGATEFIPVSSSGHLVLTPYYLGWQIAPEQAFVFDVLAQVATLAAVLIYFRSDLLGILRASVQGLINRKPLESAEARLGWYLILATIPAGIAAVLFKSLLEKAFSSPKTAALFLLITGFMLAAAELLRTDRKRILQSIDWKDALIIGGFQVFALLPGISRSGSTITGGMIRGLSRKESARFSFLMAVPVMLAAGVLGVYDLLQIEQMTLHLPKFILGFLVAGGVGYLAIRWLLNFLNKRSLLYFSAYCLAAGLLTLVTFYI